MSVQTAPPYRFLNGNQQASGYNLRVRFLPYLISTPQVHNLVQTMEM